MTFLSHVIVGVVLSAVFVLLLIIFSPVIQAFIVLLATIYILIAKPLIRLIVKPFRKVV